MTSPRRSSRNHASSVSLDAQIAFGTGTLPVSLTAPDATESSTEDASVVMKEVSSSSSMGEKLSKKKHLMKKKQDKAAAKMNAPLKRKFGSPPCSTLKVVEPKPTVTLKKKKTPKKEEPQLKKKKVETEKNVEEASEKEQARISMAREATEERENTREGSIRDTEDEDSRIRELTVKVEPSLSARIRELTVKEVIEKRIRLGERYGERSPAESPSIPVPDRTPLDPSVGIPDPGAHVLPPESLFANEALARVLDNVAPAVSQFSINNIKYLPLGCLMNEEGFTVSLIEPVLYNLADGRVAVSTLADALKMGGIPVKRRLVGKELLVLLRQAGLVVHYAFFARLMPTRLNDSESASAEEKAAAASQNPQHDAVRRTVAELIADRRRLTGDYCRSVGSTPLNGNGTTYKPRLSGGIPTAFSAAYLANSSVGSSSGGASAPISVGDYYQQIGLPTGCQTPLKISDPEHLNRFIGMVAPEGESEKMDEASVPTAAPPNNFADIDRVPNLSVTEKILLIADYDAGLTEEDLAKKYLIQAEKVAAVLRLRVPLIREQTRIIMERRRMNRVKMPIRRTNFVGLNIMMWRFFKDCRERGIVLTGKQLKEHALTIAHQLGLNNFKGSEGWLDAFKRRHKIDLRTMTGQAVNYEEDDEGNIVCCNPSGNVTDEEDGMSNPEENSMSPGSPGRCNGATDALLAQCHKQVTVMASVSSTSPLDFSEMQINGPVPGSFESNMNGGYTGGTVVEDGDFKVDECSLIAAIVKSTGIRVNDKEAAAAMDTLRTFIVTHTPEVMNSFVEMQQKLAAAYDRINRSTCSTNGDKKDLMPSVVMPNGSVATPPYVNGGPGTPSTFKTESRNGAECNRDDSSENQAPKEEKMEVEGPVKEESSTSSPSIAEASEDDALNNS